MNDKYPSGPASLFSEIARGAPAAPVVIERYCSKCRGLMCFRYIGQDTLGRLVYVDGCGHRRLR